MESIDYPTTLVVTLSLGFIITAYVAYSYKTDREPKSLMKTKKKTSETFTSSKRLDKKPLDELSASKLQSERTSSVLDTNDTNSFKGYKINADGKKTTYFDRQLTDAEKAILGDFSPKPISNSNDINSVDNSPQKISNIGSVWNTAGTWEEKSFSTWANKHLKEILNSASINVPNNSSSSIFSINKDAVSIY